MSIRKLKNKYNEIWIMESRELEDALMELSTKVTEWVDEGKFPYTVDFTLNSDTLLWDAVIVVSKN